MRGGTTAKKNSQRARFMKEAAPSKNPRKMQIRLNCAMAAAPVQPQESGCERGPLSTEQFPGGHLPTDLPRESERSSASRNVRTARTMYIGRIGSGTRGGSMGANRHHLGRMGPGVLPQERETRVDSVK